jgi:4-amino-4-deoxy-L-arabinose transferase-like glycosyltransferase
VLLGIALVAGLLVRAAVLAQTAGLGTPIIDEQHYTQLAGNLLHGYGFSWGPERPTSIRPPLYPAFVAAVWSVAGEGNHQAVRLVQIVLSALTAWFVFLIGRQFFGPMTGRLAAAMVWIYPSFIFFNVTILTETLYTFLLVAFLWLVARLVDSARLSVAIAAGLALGLACLTRSSLWPLPLVLCPLLLLVLRAPMSRRVGVAALVFAGYATVIAPWAVRNTRLQGVVTIVDTMGGLNLRMGNYEHTPEDRMWDAVALEGERNWSHALRVESPGRTFTEGEKDKWAQRRAIEYIAAHPATTLRRSLIRFADFWGLEREYAAGVAQNLYEPPRWLGITVSVAMVLTFVVVAVSGAVGIWLAPARNWRADIVLLLPGLAIMAAHTIVFGHSRYHLPLIPVLALYASSLWSSRTSILAERRFAVAGAVASVAVLAAVWGRQLLFVDSGRIQGFFAHVR